MAGTPSVCRLLSSPPSLDAVRGEIDAYNMGWKKYLDARATDEARRRRKVVLRDSAVLVQKHRLHRHLEDRILEPLAVARGHEWIT